LAFFTLFEINYFKLANQQDTELKLFQRTDITVTYNA